MNISRRRNQVYPNLVLVLDIGPVSAKKRISDHVDLDLKSPIKSLIIKTTTTKHCFSGAVGVVHTAGF